MGFLPMKSLGFIFGICLALSVMGTFTFAVADLPAFDFRGSDSLTGGSITNMDADYTIDCLPTVRIRGCASLPLRKSMHIITPLGILCAGIDTLFSVIKSTQPAKTPNGKNTILLKLRI
jgi:hypothetical protein